MYFFDKLPYSITEGKKLSDEKAELKAMVTVKDGVKNYSATLAFIVEWCYSMTKLNILSLS